MSGKLEQGWIQYLRSKSNQSRQNQDNKTSKNRVNCAAPVATEVVADPGQSRSPGQTATSQHPDVGTDPSTKDSEETLQNPFLHHASPTPSSPHNASTRFFQKPPIDVSIRHGNSAETTVGRSRARPSVNGPDRSSRGQRPAPRLFDPCYDYPSRNAHWTLDMDGKQAPRVQQSPPSPSRLKSANKAEGFRVHIDPEKPHITLAPQPETTPISHEQLVAEVKGIYTGLVMIEAKCIEVDTTHTQSPENQLSSEQWQALIALHRTLLHEHHAFFLASQHPAASEALRRLARRDLMPARMWRHGIHSFLELLRHRLPASFDQMITFIYLAYSMMALLYETTSKFEDTWIECLGDIARYRMAIEDADIKDRETWTGVARSWYSLASEKAPSTGRLYHHLAILARPNAVQQLFYYVKGLCVRMPFSSAKESIMMLFDPLLGTDSSRLSAIDTAFVHVHAVMYSGKCTKPLDSSVEQYLELLDTQISRSTEKWRDVGFHTAVSSACALLGYDLNDHLIFRGRFADREEPVAFETSMSAKSPSFLRGAYETAGRRWADPNTLPFIHTMFAFMRYMFREIGRIRRLVTLEEVIPWKHLSAILNYLVSSSTEATSIVDSENFPGTVEINTPRPLPEDYAMRGLVYTEEYYSTSWFENDMFEEDEKFLETPSVAEVSVGRQQSEDKFSNRGNLLSFLRQSSGAARAFRRIMNTASASALTYLGIWAALTQPAFAAADEEKPKQSSEEDGIPAWVFPLVFGTFALYIHLAGWYSGERQKWYMLAMGISNLSFPWLAEHERVSPMLTACVFITAVYFGCAYALVDYGAMRPPPAFYMLVTVAGLTFCAAINSLCQSASIAGLGSASGGNPFSIYLLFSMTASVVVGGQVFAWLDVQAARWHMGSH